MGMNFWQKDCLNLIAYFISITSATKGPTGKALRRKLLKTLQGRGSGI